jgi:hypothetical protein
MTRKILREIKRIVPKATVTVNGRSHYRVELSTGTVVVVSGTPGCQRAPRNMAADIRRQMRQHPDTKERSNL